MHDLPIDADALAAGPIPGQSPLRRFVKGLDGAARFLSNEEMDALGDFFTRNVLKLGRNPLTLRNLIAEIEAISGGQTVLRKTFLVAEGAYPRSQGVTGFTLNARLAITWHRADVAATDIMVSASPSPDSQDGLLQLIA